MRAAAPSIVSIGTIKGGQRNNIIPDSVEMAAEGGVVAIAQPGGSIRDSDSIEAADRLGISMVLTGTRHFKH